MKNKYWFIIILFLSSNKLFGQEIRVNNSFIIVINNKVTTTVDRLRLMLSDSTGKKQSIDGDYYPGVLSVNNIEDKKILDADSVSSLTLAFDSYAYYKSKQITSNYKIKLNWHWLKHYSFIILRIVDLKNDKYKYSFEFPGWSTTEFKKE
ncbi:MAG: hypothetical protein ACTHJ8_04820 [Mucilaginibacter sp.]